MVLHGIFRNWQWSAGKAASIRDFLLTVNVSCLLPQISSKRTTDEWPRTRSSLADPDAAS